MLILIRNNGDHIEPMRATADLLVKVLDRTGRHISVIAVAEDADTGEVTIAVEPPLVPHARVVMTPAEQAAARGSLSSEPESIDPG